MRVIVVSIIDTCLSTFVADCVLILHVIVKFGKCFGHIAPRSHNIINPGSLVVSDEFVPLGKFLCKITRFHLLVRETERCMRRTRLQTGRFHSSLIVGRSHTIKCAVVIVVIGSLHPGIAPRSQRVKHRSYASTVFDLFVNRFAH